jgi:hypothetical protein
LSDRQSSAASSSKPGVAQAGIGAPSDGSDWRVVMARRLIFVILLFSYGWFHQGGGWNQNSRFDQARALADAGKLAINRYCVYHPHRLPDGSLDVELIPLPDLFAPVATAPNPNGFDLAIFNGRILPNKPPGVSIAAAPACWIGMRVCGIAGRPLDNWWTLTLLHHITTVLSIGLAGAIGGVLLFETSRRMFPEASLAAHATTALAVGLGTPIFPFATMLFDHVLVSTLLLGGFLAILIGLETASSDRAAGHGGFIPKAPGRADAILALAGFLCGAAVVTSYAAAFATLAFGAWLLWRAGPRVVWYVLGGLAPAVFLAWFHWKYCGSVFSIINMHQHFGFKSAEAVGGVFQVPEPYVAWHLLVHPHRGLFSNALVLIPAMAGWVMLLMHGRRSAEAAAVFAFFGMIFVMNLFFNGWHGGHGIGPRYLIPAIPLLALPLTRAYDGLKWPVIVITVLAGVQMLVATAVNPQVPAEILRPYGQYFPKVLSESNGVLFKGTLYTGPVSASPMGVYDVKTPGLFDPRSIQSDWNSFNVGEFWFPQSVWSVAPLVAFILIGVFMLRACVRASAAPAPVAIRRTEEPDHIAGD